MRGHAPNIKKEVESVVLLVKGTNPKYAANQIRTHIKRNSKIYWLKDNQVPSVRSIQDILSKPENRRKVEKIGNSSLEKPWTIGSLVKDEYELSPQSIPVLLEIQKQRLKDKQSLLSIREAKWVSRLCGLEQYDDTGADRMRTVMTIATWSEAYALREELCYIAGTDCDTSDLDLGLSGDFSASLNKWEWRLMADALRNTGPDHLIKDERTFMTTLHTLETMRVEIEYLRYWLGSPDLDMDGWDIYVQILQCLPDSVRSALRTLGREQVEQFFISLRDWVKQNPEWVKQHPRIWDEVHDITIMERDCSEVALKIFSSIKKSKKKNGEVKESMFAPLDIGKEITRRLGETVDKGGEQ